MNHSPVDPEEMSLRRDEDFIASLKMVGEGAPNFDPFIDDEEDDIEDKGKDLPRTYQ